MRMKKFLVFLFIIAVILISFFWIRSCYQATEKSGTVSNEEAATSFKKDQDIQRYNLEVRKSESENTGPCDTLAVREYVINNYPAGTYLLDFDKTLTYNVPKSAVVYYSEGGNQYIFALIARSKPGKRFIEPKNIVGYDQSFIDLDSTNLGTAFFYLTLFKCEDNHLSLIWEAPVPSHGGLNRMYMEIWNFLGTPYVKIDFHYARGIGHIDYNYFLINGIEYPPHLLMTYEGINFKRTLANINGDKYPDYYEFVYYDTGKGISIADSVAFIWNPKDSLYVDSRNKHRTRPY
jgi:hypothetical protein